MTLITIILFEIGGILNNIKAEVRNNANNGNREKDHNTRPLITGLANLI